MLSLEELFCCVDDFCQKFEPQWRQQLLANGLQHRRRERNLCLSEIMTILIAFHQSSYRNFKAYYQDLVQAQWRSAFPSLVSYQRFVEWTPSALLPLCAYLRECFGSCTGISFLDSTSLKVCHNRRIQQHKVFENLAARGKTSVDWFFGFKLHLVVNDKGELLNFTLTPGNTDDRQPVPGVASTAIWESLCRQGVYFSNTSKTLVGDSWGAIDHQTAAQHEQSLDAFIRSPAVAEAGDY